MSRSVLLTCLLTLLPLSVLSCAAHGGEEKPVLASQMLNTEPWSPVPGAYSNAPVSSTVFRGIIYTAIQGAATDDSVWYSKSTGGTSNPWNLGAPTKLPTPANWYTTGSPAIESVFSALWVLSRGKSDNQLYYWRSSDGSSWTGPTRIGGTMTSAPYTTVCNGRLHVYYLNGTSIFHTSTDGTSWLTPASISGNFAYPPAVACRGNTVEVAGVGTPIHSVWIGASSTGRDVTWSNLGGNSDAEVSVATSADGAIGVFARDADHHVTWMVHANSGSSLPTFANATPLGGNALSKPLAVALPSSRNLDHVYLVITKGDNGHLWAMRTYGSGSTLSGWTDYQGTIYQPESLTLVSTQKWSRASTALAVLRTSDNNSLYYKPIMNPLLAEDLADPSIIWDTDTYFAFGTNTPMKDNDPNITNFPYFTSTDTVTWTYGGDAMLTTPLTMPQWWLPSNGVVPGDNGRWYGDVRKFDDKFVLWYFALGNREKPGGSSCATATRNGTTLSFVDHHSGRIVDGYDPFVFVESTGSNPYLLYSSNNNIYSQPLDRKGCDLAPNTTPVLLYALGGGDDSPVENPSMVRVNNTYYLFYSTGRWVTANYRTRFVTCNGPNGPCSGTATTIQSTFGPLSGPGGLYPFFDRYGQLYVVFHSWLDESTDYNWLGSEYDWSCISYPCRKSKRNAFVFPLILPSGGTPSVRYY